MRYFLIIAVSVVLSCSSDSADNGTSSNADDQQSSTNTVSAVARTTNSADTSEKNASKSTSTPTPQAIDNANNLAENSPTDPASDNEGLTGIRAGQDDGETAAFHVTATFYQAPELLVLTGVTSDYADSAIEIHTYQASTDSATFLTVLDVDSEGRFHLGLRYTDSAPESILLDLNRERIVTVEAK